MGDQCIKELQRGRAACRCLARWRWLAIVQHFLAQKNEIIQQYKNARTALAHGTRGVEVVHKLIVFRRRQSEG